MSLVRNDILNKNIKIGIFVRKIDKVLDKVITVICRDRENKFFVFVFLFKIIVLLSMRIRTIRFFSFCFYEDKGVGQRNVTHEPQ